MLTPLPCCYHRRCFVKTKSAAITTVVTGIPVLKDQGVIRSLPASRSIAIGFGLLVVPCECLSSLWNLVGVCTISFREEGETKAENQSQWYKQRHERHINHPRTIAFRIGPVSLLARNRIGCVLTADVNAGGYLGLLLRIRDDTNAQIVLQKHKRASSTGERAADRNGQ